ncbi:pro-sigmaK processing inhibitor BofA family protein [Paenibacillus sp. JX-17]|uniref:Pro-sigmaK processing inhibitor BofA family protein n=1 Tax=Paenibacillus lacisoli TaxID=3064525 RepID=A0ABT9CHA9_9BACL|nr:pro-sigmaK processing inhibitor BofA family protein [Paenibacillus sp. JX-17]MDO7908661.1 pro-sigmaK processing inhibitor BofA family protein [Paenibacillus sp. JX-17]
MKIAIWGVLILSLSAIVLLSIRRRIGAAWLTVFGFHLVLAAVALYAVNELNWPGYAYIPLNPYTIGTVAVLGLPGVAMIYALKITLIS